MLKKLSLVLMHLTPWITPTFKWWKCLTAQTNID